jgi:bifunctional UDP-N-acetylglucosamine pyrophosphorylase/glucosamine-1-phosphate N-acetyltransferase
MKTIILCAGKSTRTYPLTLTRPKPLLPVAGIPILHRNLNAFISHTDTIILVVGYKKSRIMETIGDEYRGIPVEYIHQDEPLGTGDAVRRAERLLETNFLVAMGDDLYDPVDIECLIKHSNSFLVKEVPDISRFGRIVAEDGKLTGIEEASGVMEKGLANTALYNLTPEVFRYLQEEGLSERGEVELPQALVRMSEYLPIGVVEGSGYWHPIGYPWDLLKASVALDGESECWLGEGVEVGVGADVGGSIVMEGSVIGAGSSVRHSVVGSGVVVGEGVVVETKSGKHKTVHSEVKGEIVNTGMREFGCVLGDGVRVGDGARLSAGVKVGVGVEIEAGEVVGRDIKSEDF